MSATPDDVHRLGEPGVTRVAILGCVHGNEPCGGYAVDVLRERFSGSSLPHGLEVLLIIGNPRARSQGRRCGEGGTDLNRLFGEEPEDGTTYEHLRAAALRPLLESSDWILDLHSGTAKTPPFAIATEGERSVEIAERLGVPNVTTGWHRAAGLLDKVTIGIAARQSRVGLTIECGQHNGEDTKARALSYAERFIELASGETLTRHPARHLVYVQTVRKTSPAFRFTNPLRGFGDVLSGEVFASDGELELRAPEALVALLPNEHVAVGGDALYLARAVGSGTR